MIGVFSFLSLRYAQFVYKYTNVLDEYNIDYELIVWNRDSVKKPEQDNWIFYDYSMNSFQPFYKKILGFIKFSVYMRSQIKKKKYDKLIILTTQTAIPLFDILLFKYKEKYIYDYRDVTFENIPLYLKVVNKLIKSSYFTAISSLGFKNNLLDCDKFVVSHNTRDFQINHVVSTKSNRIRIVYWGMVRQLEFNKKICDLFGNDMRFELLYHGSGYHDELKKYCSMRGYSNIHITGAYSLSDIPRFVKDTDVILNCYENDKKQKLAMTVKYYDAISYERPMIVMSESYMSQLVEEYGLGFVISLDESLSIDNLYYNINSFDYEVFLKSCRIQYEKIKDDDQKFIKKVLEFCEYAEILCDESI